MSYITNLKLNNPSVYRVIKNSYQTNKLAHAYIFSADKNTEIINSPKFLIEVLISNNSIFENNTARNFNSYPDLQILDGSKALLTKDLIKDALDKLAMKPLDERGVKILYIRNIENTNKQSLNALLKILEEPMNDTYIIMTTNNIHNVIATIKSRAIEIKVRGIVATELAKELIELGVDQSHANVLASFCKSQSDALDTLESKDFAQIYEKIIIALREAYSQPEKLIAHFLGLISKSNHEMIMSILLSFVKDIIKIKARLPIANQSSKSLIAKYGGANFNYNLAFKAINYFLIMQKYNVNFSLQKNKFLLEFEQCYE